MYTGVISVFSLLAQLLVLTFGQVSMQLSQNALQSPPKSLLKSAQKSAQTSDSADAGLDQLPDLRQSEPKRQAPKRQNMSPTHPFKQSWVRTTVFTGAAASMVLPLVHKSVTTSYQDKPAETTVPPTAAAPTRSQNATQAIGQGKAVLPQTSDPVKANFSGAAARLTQTGISTDSGQPSNPAAQPALITRDKDGNWTLSQQAQAGQVSNSQAKNSQAKEAQRAQVAVAQLAQEATRTDGLSQQACQGGSCGGLTYIDSQLPKARQQVKAIQSQIKQFEATHAQQDMGAYRQVLEDRMAEIDQQKNQLAISTGETRQQIDEVKTRLAAVDPDGLGVAIVDRALFQDAAYQAAWSKLVGSENSLLEEFSSANIDATALNEIYGDYQFQQQTLQRAAAEALNNYFSSTSGKAPPSFIQQSPDSLSLLQDLTTSAYEYQVQLLRLGTIDQIKQKLLGRQRQLSVDMGQYEQLQRQQAIAQQQVGQYEQAREKILTQQEAEQSEIIANGSAESKPQGGTALERARALAPQLPEGSAAQAVMFAVLAAGVIAAISARRTAKQTALPKQTVLPQWALEGAGSPLKLQGVTTPKAAILPALNLDQPSVLPDLDNFFAGATSNESAADFEQRMLAELQALTGRSARVVNEVPAASYSAEDSLTIEIMTRDLDDIFQQATKESLEGSLLAEINERAKAPAKLPLKEIDAFADHAVRWILKDLGMSQPAVR